MNTLVAPGRAPARLSRRAGAIGVAERDDGRLVQEALLVADDQEGGEAPVGHDQGNAPRVRREVEGDRAREGPAGLGKYNPELVRTIRA